MNRTIMALCFLLATGLAARTSSAGPAGEWTASISGDRPGHSFELSMRTGTSQHEGSTYDLSDFTGLTREQTQSATRVPVQFEMRREAGTIAFEGTFRSGQGAGQFTFTPNPDYARALRSLGLELGVRRQDEDHEMYSLAIFDVSTGFIRSMQALGYKEPLEMYEQFRIFDVDPEYIHDMASVGFDHLPAEKLVETRIHGATPEYVRAMRAKGDDLPLEGYIESRIFDVSPEFADEMGRLGLTGLDHDMLVQFRIQGVTADFVRELRRLGYDHVPAGKLVEMRIYGVTPEFIRRLARAGYTKVPLEKLIQLRIYDIKPEMVKALDDASH
jgi:hypothetical protein